MLFSRSSIVSLYYKDPVVNHGVSSSLHNLYCSHPNVALLVTLNHEVIPSVVCTKILIARKLLLIVENLRQHFDCRQF